MSPFVQETDSIELYSIPITTSFTKSKVDFGETFGVADEGHLFPMPKGSAILRHAWEFVRKLDNKQKAEKAKHILCEIHKTLYLNNGFDGEFEQVPPLHAFKVEDGSVLFEWILDDFRIGFSVEPNLDDSSWYLVSREKFGDTSTSGSLDNNEDIKFTILCLMSILQSRT